MLAFMAGDVQFSLRAAGVAVDRGRVLLHRTEDHTYWSLPGGRVEPMEAAAEALAREFREELGEEVTVGRLLWVVENFFEYGGCPCHELGFYFAVEFGPRSAVAAAEEPFRREDEGMPMLFTWHRLENLAGLTIAPPALQERLAHLPECTQHIVNRKSVEER